MKLGKLMFAGPLLLGAMALHAEIIVVGPVTQSGGGFGGADNFLTIRAGGQDITKAGCIAAASGGGNVQGECDIEAGSFQGGDEHPPGNDGVPQFNNIFDFGGSGAENISLFLNASQTGGSVITLEALILTLYDSDGGVLWSSDGLLCNGVVGCEPASGGGIELTTQAGIGQLGWEFGLTAGQASDLNAEGAGRLGLAARLIGTGGLDTFQIDLGDGGGQEVIPEPSTWAMLLSGAVLVGGRYIRRRRQM